MYMYAQIILETGADNREYIGIHVSVINQYVYQKS